MIRNEEETNNDNFNWGRIEKFNDFIQYLELTEIRSSGLRFTWSNKQSNIVLEVLDRFLVSSSWEKKFPLCTSRVIPCIFSDHKPMLLDSGVNAPKPPHKFRKEKEG
ncbi:hypothetical protein PR202_ga02011 [Eleusine coracana subsp. coracana]|uniref:Uncharacterized protein n=1 Tax=Eleusine coracana subsp. coracana TaxID=191504 RepID=A0AAV5BKK0_ELECO|nr:hypothetical protein PR202_ga01324 [Eleusine coracana subsp. coracana]GJM86178.1 hypothetical protein PR202_ga02011 [Eleusine coracana subsp. coracana]